MKRSSIAVEPLASKSAVTCLPDQQSRPTVKPAIIQVDAHGGRVHHVSFGQQVGRAAVATREKLRRRSIRDVDHIDSADVRRERQVPRCRDSISRETWLDEADAQGQQGVGNVEDTDPANSSPLVIVYEV